MTQPTPGLARALVRAPGMKRPPTEKQIRAALPGTYGFGAGLYLKVRKTGHRSWEYRYKSLKTNRYTTIVIGNALSYDIEEARRKIFEWPTLKERENQDPSTSKRIQQASGTTFGQVADQWIEVNKNGWSASQLKTANLRLKLHGKILAGKVIAHIDVNAVEQAIKPLWLKAPKQAHRTLAMWARIFAYAKHKKYFTHDNPATWKDNLEYRFSKPTESEEDNHYPHLPYEKVPSFIKELRTHRSTSAIALEFCIFTATRSGETLGARWDEFDANRVWTIPAERMKGRNKNKKQHRVPLSDRVMVLYARLEESRRNNIPFLFKGRNQTQIEEKGMRVLLRNMDVRAVDGRRATVHGFRSSFKTWATEKTDHPWEVIELCLSHKIGNAVARAYLRGDALDKRRIVMAEWADYCCRI
jgi:integrase